MPVKIDNDANAAAVAGKRNGARGVVSQCFLRLHWHWHWDWHCMRWTHLPRTHRSGGEGGHVSIDYRGPRCKCGKPGCIEILASGTAIAERARKKLSSKDTRSSLLALAHGNIEAVTSEMVGQAHADGDPIAGEILQETIGVLSLWLSNVVDLLEPDVMILGGGVAAMLSSSFDEIRSRIQQYCVNSRSGEIPLLPARYGADAGIAGGAALC